jgi:hypothetical protein
MVELDTKQRAKVMEAARHFQVVLSEDGNRLAVVDPTRTVDGQPREVATFDLSVPRDINAFMMLLVAPSLTAAGLDPYKIFGKEDPDTEGAA